MNNNRNLSSLYQRQRLLQIGLFSLVTVAVWVGLSLFQSQQKTSISAQLRQLALPLTPSINTSVLDEIRSKRSFSASELQNFPIYRYEVSEDGRSQTLVPINQNNNTFANLNNTTAMSQVVNELVSETNTAETATSTALQTPPTSTLPEPEVSTSSANLQ